MDGQAGYRGKSATSHGSRAIGARGPECAVCGHPQRKAIELGLLQGERTGELAALYDLKRRALRRHWRECMKSAIAAAAERIEVISGRDLLEDLEELRNGARSDYRELRDLCSTLRDRARAENATVDMKDVGAMYRAKAAASREWMTTLSRYWEMIADVAEESQATFADVPGFVEYQQAILGALAEYPDAKAAVQRALASLGSAESV